MSSNERILLAMPLDRREVQPKSTSLRVDRNQLELNTKYL